MKIVINIAPDPESILIYELKKHFFEDVRFKILYPNFGNVRISEVHPFAFLVDQEINGTKVPVGIFPSVTVVNDNDMENPTVDVTIQFHEEIKITSAEIADMETNKDKYIISDKDIKIMKDLLLDESTNELYAEGIDTFMRASMVMEVWTENAEVKNAIYDIIRSFLLGKKRFEIQESYDIVIANRSIRGEKSGNYNFDFGFITYGGILRCDVDFKIRQYIVDIDNQEVWDKVTHGYTEVHHNEQS